MRGNNLKGEYFERGGGIGILLQWDIRVDFFRGDRVNTPQLNYADMLTCHQGLDLTGIVDVGIPPSPPLPILKIP